MVKRIFDFTASFIGLLLIWPFFILIALLIVLDSKGPVFFRQIRVGRHAKPFKMVKFRTMTIQQESTSSVSVKGDSRITRYGAVLRRFKLDELPELWNVIKGEMSLVGPRPDVPGYADCLNGKDRMILELRPGITGPASLVFANEEEILSKVNDPEKYNREVIFTEKVRINLDYYNRRNLLLDLKIIFATIFRTNY